MTVCAALITPEGCWMGADSLAADEDLGNITATPKCGVFGDLLIGFSGNWKAGQTMFDMARKANQPTMAQLLENYQTDLKDWNFLFVEDGKIYEVDEDLAVLEMTSEDGYSFGAIGSGAQPALGALFVSHDDEGGLMRALEAAAQFTTNVRAPFRIVAL